MFSGLVETVGVLRSRRTRDDGQRLSVTHQEFAGEALAPGESIAVAGVCLTVVGLSPDGFEADVSTETLACSTLGALPEGAGVNLERALRLGDRLGGHLVAGHVDAVAEVFASEPDGENRTLSVRLAPKLAQYVARKGSVTLDGVSLTVNQVASEAFTVNLIPHTLKATTLLELQPGAQVNLEVDLVARYLARMYEKNNGQD